MSQSCSSFTPPRCFTSASCYCPGVTVAVPGSSGCIVTACLLQCLAVGVDALVLKMKHVEHSHRFLLSRLAEVSCLLPLGVEQSCFIGACQCISLLKSPSPAAHPSHRHHSTTANIYKSLSPSLLGQTVMLVTLYLP